MGIWIAFAFVVFMFALMGRALYSTYRDRPPDLPPPPGRIVLDKLDAIDVSLVFLAWLTIVPNVLAFPATRLSRFAGPVLILGLGFGILWLRRRLFPGSVVLYHPDNVLLRCGWMLCGIGAPITLFFGAFAGSVGESPAVAWIFFLLGGGLALTALACCVAELRRMRRWASSSPES